MKLNWKWIISITATLAIWGAGIYSYFYIKENIPERLPTKSSIILADKNKEVEETSPVLKEIIHDVQKLVVKIELPDGSLGSGFLFNDKGDVITNAHVVANAKDVTVKTADSRELQGTVIGISDETDVALVRVAGLAGTEPLKLAKNRKAEVGDEVLALGTPLGLENTVTTGIISGNDRDLDIAPFHYEDVYQISAPIAPGNSGGPLIDSKTGEVLGVNSAGTEVGSIGFSIPVSNFLNLVEGWAANPLTTLPSIAMGDDGGYATASEEEQFSIEDQARYLVNYFYESLDYGDYVTAYALLGSNWQTKTSYETFRKGYINTEAVTVDDIMTSASGEQVTATAFITAEETKDGDTTYSKYKVTYQIGYENNQMKILTGEGKTIK
ncbi:S1C family serine protease [Bacillus marasmi]|uniref:S1C family serine protease n=1 Tax=Bacillus marasmi TaxID=1926279 RepID=UPI0011CC8EFF|nr:trypsin-like peptidase domain-containing protein [Bacillus marasmi]